MNISLIGFRGTGKTTVGKKLAKRLGMRFADLDEEISRRAEKGIPEIFAEAGEPGFRDLEEKALQELAASDNLCMACGGGVVLREGNVDTLKRKSIVILLEARPGVIWARIKGDSNRPALTGKGGMEEVLHLLGEREKRYSGAAMARFDTSDDSVERTVQRIVGWLGGRGLI